MSRATFEEKLSTGLIAEGVIANWLRRVGGWTLIPAYEIEYSTGKGPRVFTPSGQIIAPDILAVKGAYIRWIEAKQKSVWSWHRKSQRWVTGIDRHHFREYLRVAEHIGWEIWILFLHTSQTPDARDIAGGCPETCPAGLFGERLSTLQKTINHEHENWGRTGMVYWSHESLLPIASLDEVLNAARIVDFFA